MNRLIILAVVVFALCLVEWYVFKGLKFITINSPELTRKVLHWAYWLFTAAVFGSLIFLLFFVNNRSGTLPVFLGTLVFANLIAKLFVIIILLGDDIRRGLTWLWSYFQYSGESGLQGKAVTRSEFLTKAALTVGAVPIAAMSYGILKGAHDYQIRRIALKLPNLPKAFEGMQIAQLSDIHSGSFFNKRAVQGGVEMLMAEKPDVVFFTGDLVNNEASELKDYLPVFEKVKAPLGVFSVLGNHDYGDYKNWSSPSAKEKNLKDLMEGHRQLGWDLLNNEHRMLDLSGEKIAILGNENWGAGRFAKYGDLQQAYRGSEEASVKLLLSHDPSHWDAEVRTTYPDIDVMFAGHTHGFQFGVEVGSFRWSPVQYVYKQWAGLYREGHQQLYVNRGFGFIGFPGRIGIAPEITLFTLERA